MDQFFSGDFFQNLLDKRCDHFHNYPQLAGHGFDSARLPNMLMCIPYFFFWFVLRKICKSAFPHAARWCGLRSPQKIEKFSYQMWLGLYYTLSTLAGIYGYKDEQWFQFPIGDDACRHMFDMWPSPTTGFMEFAYQYQLGFYFAELYAIFNEPRRSDFLEYVIHHVTTILLVALSNIGMQMRVGCYVFFIHDIPDIFLCFAKICHYLKKEVIVNVLFVLFVLTFAFNRLVCLPSATHCIYCTSPGFSSSGAHSTLTFHFLAFLLGIVLQALHVFWFALILRMIFRLVTGVKGDVRSDDDDDEVEAAAITDDDQNKKKKKETKKTK